MNKKGVISVEDLPSPSAPEQSRVPHLILVVDDDNDARQLSVDLLVDSGYQVAAVKDGAAGWEAVQADKYDLVITDNKMPKMSGVEMIEKIRDARMTLPIIMATRFLPKYTFVNKPWLQADATLERPCSNNDFLETVQRLLHTADCYKARMDLLLPRYLWWGLRD
jgi:CheY-like chemotaxis protein